MAIDTARNISNFKPAKFQQVQTGAHTLQQMFNGSAELGSLGDEKALYLDELSDAAIAVIGEHVPKKIPPQSFCPTFTMSGVYRTPGDADTAFGGPRSVRHVFNIEAATKHRATYEADRTWVRGSKSR